MKSGFTLIELILVIAILGILAISAIPKFFDLADKAEEAVESGIAGSVRSGVALYAANVVVGGGDFTYPTSLDSATTGNASSSNPFFTNVLQNGVTSGWNKVGNQYRYQPTNTLYQYNSTTGTFAP